MAFSRPDNIPFDLLPLILNNLTSKRDLYHCALVDHAFHDATIPILYRTLDVQVRILKNGPMTSDFAIVHPSRTLLERPEWAQYVRTVEETGASGTMAPDFMPLCQQAFKLCTNLESFSWTGGGFLSNSDADLLLYLNTIVTSGFPVRHFMVRATPGLRMATWNRMQQLTTLKSLGIWSLVGEHEVLQSWFKQLGQTLVHLELAIGSLTDKYTQYIALLPRLRSLHLKNLQGSASTLIQDILVYLPDLHDLDVEYYGPGPSGHNFTPPLASLSSLAVTTSVVGAGPVELWSWIQQLVPRPSLESLTLHAYSAQGSMSMPQQFTVEFSHIHGHTLRKLDVENITLSLMVLDEVCTRFDRLESLSCALPGEIDSHGNLEDIVVKAHNLRRLKLLNSPKPADKLLAASWMRHERSKLRHIEFGKAAFVGQWVYGHTPGNGGPAEAHFEVQYDTTRSISTWI